MYTGHRADGAGAGGAGAGADEAGGADGTGGAGAGSMALRLREPPLAHGGVRERERKMGSAAATRRPRQGSPRERYAVSGARVGSGKTKLKAIAAPSYPICSATSAAPAEVNVAPAALYAKMMVVPGETVARAASTKSQTQPT